MIHLSWTSNSKYARSSSSCQNSETSRHRFPPRRPRKRPRYPSMGWPNAKCKHGSLLFSVVKSATSPDSQELKTSLNSVDSLLMEFPRSQQLRFTVRPFLLRCASMRNSHRRHSKGGAPRSVPDCWQEGDLPRTYQNNLACRLMQRAKLWLLRARSLARRAENQVSLKALELSGFRVLSLGF